MNNKELLVELRQILIEANASQKLLSDFFTLFGQIDPNQYVSVMQKVLKILEPAALKGQEKREKEQDLKQGVVSSADVVKSQMAEAVQIPDAAPVTSKNIKVIEKNIKKVLPKGLSYHMIGSGGRKESSGDLDILVDLADLIRALNVKLPEDYDPNDENQEKLLSRKMRVELENYIKSKSPDTPTKKSGVIVHMGIDTGEGTLAQVDIMLVANAGAISKMHQHDYSDNPNMKGGTLYAIWTELIKLVPPPKGEEVAQGDKSYYQLRPWKGIWTRTPKALVTTDKDEFANLIVFDDKDANKIKASDIDSVKKMLNTLQKYAPQKLQLILSKIEDKLGDDKLNEELLSEAKVGREYQHLEDLLIVNGSEGGFEAIELLEKLVTEPEMADFKWDGGAAVYWGRDEKGNFYFAPKNQWNKAKPLSKEQLSYEIENTGRPRKGQSEESFKSDRRNLAAKYSRIYEVFENATPENFVGFLNGDLMFDKKQTPDKDGNYTFTPNKVTYTVSEGGLFGKMPTAEVFVVVHGIIEGPFGTKDAGNLKPVSENIVQEFNKTDLLIVLPTQKPKTPPKKIPELDEVKASIRANTNDINTVVNYTAPKFSNFKTILYTYAVQRAKSGINFMDWLETSKLSENQKRITSEFIQNNTQAFEDFWMVFDKVNEVKVKVLEDIFLGHEKIMKDELGISASIGGKPGGEGLVISRKGGGFGKLINPAFRKADVASRFQSINEEVEELKKMVIGWGRGMGHKGHMALASAVIDYANKIGAEPLVLLSRSFGPKDPLPPEVKLGIYHKVFPNNKQNIIISPEGLPNIYKFLGNIKETEGTNYDITLIVGSDQLPTFKSMERFENDKMAEDGKERFEKFKVLSRQEASGSDFEGPRATPLRNALKDPERSEDEAFRIWRDAMPDELSDEEIRELITIAKKNMGISESSSRSDFMQEEMLRENIRKAIKVISDKRSKKMKPINEEVELRKIIRKLIGEATRPEATPHQSTGINVLEDLLKKIIPVLQQDYKQITTDPEQRQSFRAHILNAIEKTLAPERAIASASLEEQEEISFDVKPEDDENFIDVEDKEEDPKEEFGIEGEEETGRNLAFNSFKSIGNQIVDSYALLGNPQDRKLFHDYLITNVKLYFDKFDKELEANLTEPTTPEYEKEKSQELPSEDETGLEL